MKNYFTSITFFLITFLSFSQNYESKIDSIISLNYNDNEPGISFLVAKDGKTIYHKALGKANLELNTSLQTKSIFQIGSITKQFTAISILLLAEQGKLNLKDKIERYIPQYAGIGQGITIHHLLNHTSGIKNKTLLSDKNFISRTDVSPTELIAYFKNEPLEFFPGEQFKYSNAGYILLGKIIEIVSKKSYGEFIKEHIFDKVDMNSSSYGKKNQIIQKSVLGYKVERNKIIKVDDMNLSLAYSAGGILSTTSDLLKWQNALFSNTLLKASSIKKAMTPTLLNNGKKIPYGYGFRFSKLGKSPVIAHTGSTKGFTSLSVFLPKEKVYITALSNCNCKKISSLAKEVASQFIFIPKVDKKITSERKSIKVDLKKLREYVGSYEVRSNVSLTIGIDETNHLYLLAPGQTKRIPLFAAKENHFFVKELKVEVIFNKEDNQMISLTMNQSGRKITAKKR
ncbi:serine hydrolase domain-containing protein [Tenacibaculum retecalamus]|uniref:serine hydrolase domain-containing protein n=1 Tax=Tenacibaculum retecalamus TaxID=3018315 RepID=UPI0023D9054F|nr:serine hydrolase domain-containing protein [Tenacibaculum retecalamus]WBX72316.1 serine hydrolase [Tenacibaculum retecalamus]